MVEGVESVIVPQTVLAPLVQSAGVFKRAYEPVDDAEASESRFESSRTKSTFYGNPKLAPYFGFSSDESIDLEPERK